MGALVISGAARILSWTLGLTFLVKPALALNLGNCTEYGNWQPCPTSDPRFNPTYESYRGLDVVWQIPTDPRGVLFIVNGMNQGPLAFFDQGPHCKACYGLPECRTAVLDALGRGYAVLALKSVDIAWVPWPPESSADVEIATSLVPAWTKAHALEHLPLVAWGHSIGGDFVATLSLLLPIRAVVAMCSHLSLEMMDIYPPARFSPMFFAHMDRDTDTSLLVEKWVSLLRERGIPVGEKRMFPLPLSPHFFSDRVACVSERLSERLYAAYKVEDGWLDGDDLLLMQPNVPDCNWEAVLWKQNALPFCERHGDLCLGAHVLQELSVAYAMHTFSREANDEIFSWLEDTVFRPQSWTEPVDMRPVSTGTASEVKEKSTIGGVRYDL